MTSIYYDVLHSLEESGALEPSSYTHLFCAQYVFLPRIQDDLDAFTNGWNNHPMKTERNLTPNQQWEIGCATSLIDPPVQVSPFMSLLLTQCKFTHSPRHTVYCIPSIALQDQYTPPHEMENQEIEPIGIIVPQPHCPLTEEEMETLNQLFNPIAPSLSFGADLYMAVVQYVEGIIQGRE